MSKINRDNAISARELTDKIAKLGRAAAIHLILATQKVVKETIDTRVQTNINARLCLRVGTLQSSMTVLGTKSAYGLPQVPGRAVWSVGSTETIVQVPKLLNEDLQDEVSVLTEKFNGKVQNYYGPMIAVETKGEVESKSVSELTDKANPDDVIRAT